MFNEYTYFNGVQEKVETCSRLMDSGRPEPTAHGRRLGGGLQQPVRLDEAGAVDFGGTRNGMVVSCQGHQAKNELRTQFSHVIDVAPTVLQAIGLPSPRVSTASSRCRCRHQLVYSFEDAKAKERHTTQYFEIAGNRAIYHDGWLRARSTAPVGSQGAPYAGGHLRLGAVRRALGLQPGQ